MAKTWRNWSGGVSSTWAQIAVPGDETAWIELLSPQRGPVRVAGSDHSFTPLCATHPHPSNPLVRTRSTRTVPLIPPPLALADLGGEYRAKTPGSGRCFGV